MQYTNERVMQALYQPKLYPKRIIDEVERMPVLATEIANRWMLGWPKTVKALIKTGEYLDALKRQEETERTLFSRGDLRHLARHEICEEYGLTPMPPTPCQ